MSLPATLSDRLEVVVSYFNARRVGRGFQCFCPAHDDKKKPSLSISDGDGKILLYCHKNCSFDSIVATCPPDIQELIRGSRKNKRKKYSGPKIPLAYYVYVRPDGTEAFQTVRYSDKTFGFRHSVDDGKTYIDEKPSDSNYPYNLPLLLAAIDKGETIYVVEGEKDCQTLEGLGIAGTTNSSGGKSWPKALGKWFNGAKDIVICEDNDITGHARVPKVYKALKLIVPNARFRVVRFRDQAEHYDITDYLEDGGTFDTLISRFEDLTDEHESIAEDTTPRDAKIKDYVTLAEKRFGKIKRELLSNEIVIFDKGIPAPLLNREKVLRSMCRETRLTSHIKYKSNEVMDAIIDHADGNLKGELLLELEEWDGIDRISDICQVLQFENVSSYCFEQIIKKWGADIFRRLEDPDTQPITPIVMGPQGVGKDTLLKALCGGFGEGPGGYFANLKLSKNKIDDALKDLHSKLVWNIAEFDHTAKTEHAILKDLLTASSIRSRLSYDARPEDRAVRCSFIATCNVKSVFGDATGARRFVFFQLSYAGLKMQVNENGLIQGVTPVVVERHYPGMWVRADHKKERQQILAQYRYLAKTGFQGDDAAWEEMRVAMSDLTPQDYKDAVCEDWEAAIENETTTTFSPDGTPIWESSSVNEIIMRISKEHGFGNKRVVQSILKDRGYAYRNKNKRYFFGKVPQRCSVKVTAGDSIEGEVVQSDEFAPWED
jgi:hypothetical protein